LLIINLTRVFNTFVFLFLDKVMDIVNS